MTTALRRIDGWDVPAAGVVVVGPDGELDRHGDVTSPHRIASVSKLLTAWALLTGVEEGAVELDDRVGPPDVTLRHLMAHAGGYGFESGSPRITAPGSRRVYSNHGVEEAGRHLEAATGIPVARYVAEAVTGPLGMAATDTSGSPAFGMRSTVADLGRFATEMLAPRLLHPDTVAGAVEVAFPGLPGIVPGVGRFDPCDWGLGPERNFGRTGHWAGTAVSLSAFGHFGGAGSFLWVDPERRIGCACLTGRDFGPWAMQVWPDLCSAVVAAYA